MTGNSQPQHTNSECAVQPSPASLGRSSRKIEQAEDGILRKAKVAVNQEFWIERTDILAVIGSKVAGGSLATSQ